MFRKFSTFGKITNSKRMRRELAFHKYFQEEKSEVTRKCLTKSLLYSHFSHRKTNGYCTLNYPLNISVIIDEESLWGKCSGDVSMKNFICYFTSSWEDD